MVWRKTNLPSKGGEGMIWNQPTPTISKPCSDCMILGMNAGLEYTDGSDANTDTGLWLHHVCFKLQNT
jgi:hypothetical protein